MSKRPLPLANLDRSQTGPEPTTYTLIQTDFIGPQTLCVSVCAVCVLVCVCVCVPVCIKPLVVDLRILHISVCVCGCVCVRVCPNRNLDVNGARFIRVTVGISLRYVGDSGGIL